MLVNKNKINQHSFSIFTPSIFFILFAFLFFFGAPNSASAVSCVADVSINGQSNSIQIERGSYFNIDFRAVVSELSWHDTGEHVYERFEEDDSYDGIWRAKREFEGYIGGGPETYVSEGTERELANWPIGEIKKFQVKATGWGAWTWPSRPVLCSETDIISVEVVPEAINAADDHYVIEAGELANFKVLENDSGRNISITNIGPNDLLDANTYLIGNTIDYSAPEGVNTVDEFTYTIEDEYGATDTARVTVTIEEPTGIECSLNFSPSFTTADPGQEVSLRWSSDYTFGALEKYGEWSGDTSAVGVENITAPMTPGEYTYGLRGKPIGDPSCDASATILVLGDTEPTADLEVMGTEDRDYSSVARTKDRVDFNYECSNSQRAIIFDDDTNVSLHENVGTGKTGGDTETISGTHDESISEDTEYRLECESAAYDTAVALASAIFVSDPPTASATVQVNSGEDVCYNIFVDEDPREINKCITNGNPNTHTVSVDSEGSKIEITSITPPPDSLSSILRNASGNVLYSGSARSVSGVKNNYRLEYSLTYNPVLPPTEPTILSIDASCGANEITWRDSVRENGYRIYRRIGNSGMAPSIIGVAPQNATTFRDNRATPGVIYSYTVEAYNSAGTRSSTRSVTSAPPCDGSDLCQVSILNTNSICSGDEAENTLSWECTNGDNANRFDVERWPSHLSSGSATLLGGTNGSQRAFVDDKNPTEGQRYTYRVSAHNLRGDSTQDQSSITTIICESPPPSPPSSVTANAYCEDGSPQVDVSWTSVSDADDYDIYKSSGGGSFSSFRTQSGTSLEDRSVSSGQTYRYSVGSSNDNGDSDTRTNSNTVTVPSCAVPTISLRVSPSSRTIEPGDSAVFTINVDRNNTNTPIFTRGSLDPSVSGVSHTFNPFGYRNVPSITYTVNTPSNIAPGTYTTTIDGTPIDRRISISPVSATIEVESPEEEVIGPGQAELKIIIQDSNGNPVSGGWSFGYAGKHYSGRGSQNKIVESSGTGIVNFSGSNHAGYSGYTISNTGVGGNGRGVFLLEPGDSETVTVTYTGGSAGSCSFDFTSSASAVTEGDSFTLTWGNQVGDFVGRLRASGHWGGMKDLSGFQTYSPSAGRYTYRLSGECSDGSRPTESVTVNVISNSSSGPEPELDLRVTPRVLDTDPATVSVRWYVEDMTDCDASSSDSDSDWSGDKDHTDGWHDEPLPNQEAPREYTMTCDGADGEEYTKTVNVALSPATFDLRYDTGLILGIGQTVSSRSNITVSTDGRFTSDITLSDLGISPPIPGATVHFSDPVLESSEYGTGSEVWIEVPAPISRQEYMVTIRGEGGGEDDTIVIPLNSRGDIPDYEEF